MLATDPLADALLVRYAAAFERYEIDAMMALWAERPDIVCIHPSGGRVHRGVAEVMESWLLVFSRPLDIKIERRLIAAYRADALATLTFEERVTRPGEPAPSGSLFVTQVWQPAVGASAGRPVGEHADDAEDARAHPHHEPRSRAPTSEAWRLVLHHASHGQRVSGPAPGAFWVGAAGQRH